MRDTSEGNPINPRLWLAIVLVLATGLRLFRLGTKSFWLDEAISVVMAELDRRTFFSVLVHRQANMALYYCLLRAWIRMGSSEFVVRLLSVVFGVAAILVIYLLGKDLFGRKAARIAALLLCVHAYHIRYSQEARSYTLLVLLALTSSLLFTRGCRIPSFKNWTSYVIASTLMVYVQVFGGWVLLAQWTSLLLRRDIDWRRVSLVILLICILISPIAYCLLIMSDSSQLAWLKPLSWEALYRFGLDLTGDGGVPLLLIYLSIAVCAVIAAMMRTKAKPGSLEMWKYKFLVSWWLLPIAILVLISLRRPVFEPRFLISCVPAMVLIVADALSRISSRVLFSAALIAVVGFSTLAVYGYSGATGDKRQSDDWKDATGYILTNSRPGDTVLFSYSEEQLAFDVYQDHFPRTGPTIYKFPQQTVFELLTLRPSRPSRELLDELSALNNRLWVISAFRPNQASRSVELQLQKCFRENSTLEFGFVHAELFEVNEAGAAGCVAPTSRNGPR